MTDSLQVLDKMRVSASTNPNHDPDGDSRPLAREGSSDLLGGWFLRRIWRFPSNRSYLRNQLISLGLEFGCCSRDRTYRRRSMSGRFLFADSSESCRCLSLDIVNTHNSQHISPNQTQQLT